MWYFTVNGIQYPTIPITAPDGEIWRIGTGAGSLSWDLQLINDQNHKPMTVQLIAIDGIAVTLPQDTPTNSLVSMAGAQVPRRSLSRRHVDHDGPGLRRRVRHDAELARGGVGHLPQSERRGHAAAARRHRDVEDGQA